MIPCKRVVQNARLAMTQPKTKRNAAARRTLGTNTSTCHGRVAKVAWKVQAMRINAGNSTGNVVTLKTMFSTTA